MNRRVIASALCAFSMVVAMASVAHAAPLAPGGTVGPLPIGNVVGDPSLQGIVLGTLVTPFVGLDVGLNPRFAGILETHAVREVGGTMSFYYQVTNTGGALPNTNDPIGQITNTDFGGWLTDVLQRDDAMAGIVGGSPLVGTQLGSEATRGAGLGDEVRFHFIQPPIGAGDLVVGATSLWLVIRTNAPDFALGNTAIINGGNANVPSFRPVPEPATMGLMALGALALVRRRR